MRKEARFLKANDQARSAIKQFLEAPDNELDGIIRSIRQNGNTLSNPLCKGIRFLLRMQEWVNGLLMRCGRLLAIKRMATTFKKKQH
ncbi:hypothetical protein R6242_08490 [Iodobacter sp. CM08]|uniref:hypothetical protein n=1 Tax=Iodobacter sp. CM08 TaxID=3085902 RepID=UPI002981B95C|nr:hypothetical protein [Iodobacter sp. CM08]MDW5416605.1 hypothetical protein [Iodobacter sp. CM08]